MSQETVPLFNVEGVGDRMPADNALFHQHLVKLIDPAAGPDAQPLGNDLTRLRVGQTVAGEFKSGMGWSRANITRVQ